MTKEESNERKIMKLLLKVRISVLRICMCAFVYYRSKNQRTDDELLLASSECMSDGLAHYDNMHLHHIVQVKNGTPPMRKQALRQVTDKAREFGPGPLFNQILPLLMSPTLEDQERHLLVKVIDRVLYKLDDLVRPYVHKILVVIEPLLIDEDYYARVEVCFEILSASRTFVNNVLKFLCPAMLLDSRQCSEIPMKNVTYEKYSCTIPVYVFKIALNSSSMPARFSPISSTRMLRVIWTELCEPDICRVVRLSQICPKQPDSLL